ncbi:TIGR03086 family metal-binding protein [Mycolicibacterium arenosum]|uniref:TIGR03086 family metal-binding protein n=1 Tax=Mycolicibacterium arenosum TaxID=2952157 RepID=A0ABT1MD15_9MYCO|nr:TIGR03086 family metal-binding protein [Mycolicibacterium sp. CAU 1645]MCP9276755.1 TIGR03086 family metal-binding protein [Mycolicibacterium sp. CAU 1645]
MHMPTNYQTLLPPHRTAVLHSIEVVRDVSSTDLDRPTPCAGWTLLDLLAHMTVQHHGFASAARGFGAELARWDVAGVVDAVRRNPAGTYADAAADVLAAFADAGAQTPFALPEFGADVVVSGEMAIGFHLVDYVVHGWDVAAALGRTYTVPDDVAAAALTVALAVPDDEIRDVDGAPFAHAVTGPAATDLDRVLRHLGRTPAGALSSTRR